MSDKPRTWQKKGEMKCKKKWHIQRLERSHEKRPEREREARERSRICRLDGSTKLSASEAKEVVMPRRS